MSSEWLKYILIVDIAYFTLVTFAGLWYLDILRRRFSKVCRLEDEVELLKSLLLETKQMCISQQENMELIKRSTMGEQDRKDVAARDQSGPVNPNKNIQAATWLLDRGIDSNDLVSVCGLSRGEADLLNSLHQASASRS